MIIRVATPMDVPQIVNIHMNTFDGFFLTSLGASFLSFYYNAFLNSKDSIVLCSVVDDKVCGFAAATKQCKGYNKNMIKGNLIKFIWISIRLLFIKPSALIRLVKNLSKTSDVIEDDEDYAELYSIGIAGNVQGQGIGKKLLTAIEDYMRCEGVGKISLTTDFYNNDSTVAFYRTMGYQTLYEFTSYPNRRMYRFIKFLK